MGTIKFVLGIVAGVFIASNSPDTAEMIREQTMQVVESIMQIYNSGIGK
ncbi:hypothetical protein [Photobacterium angustum]|nr:hypothetical protein [Photobacterium angustum]